MRMFHLLLCTILPDNKLLPNFRISSFNLLRPSQLFISNNQIL